MIFLSVIGDPISHSKSPIMHNFAIQSLKLNSIYTRYHLKNKENLKNIFLNLKLKGANITSPFKEKAFEIATIKDDISSNIKVSNILIKKENEIFAYNSDVFGFLKSVKDFKNIKSALILGAGSTAKSIYYALKTKNINTIIANRNLKKSLNFDYGISLYDNLKIKQYDLIVNTTGSSLYNEFPCKEQLLKELFKNSKYAFDVSYGINSKFLQLAKKYNLTCRDGMQMLLWQGVLSFELFFNIKNKQEEIKKYMQEGLSLGLRINS